MFEIKKLINERGYQQKAYERLIVQFPRLRGISSNSLDGPWDVGWFKEADRPYVLVMNVLQNDKLVRNEWYEYYKGEWHYIGYLPREECIQYVREKVWEKNKVAFGNNRKEFEKWLSEPDHRHYRASDEEAARRIREEYFTEYSILRLRK